MSLNVFFAAQNEAIDWQTDAQTTPTAFSPLCGFSATFVLNQAGSHFGLAWYNETGAPPAAAALHVLVPASTRPSASMFNRHGDQERPGVHGRPRRLRARRRRDALHEPRLRQRLYGLQPPGPLDHGAHVRVEEHAQRLLHLLRRRRHGPEQLEQRRRLQRRRVLPDGHYVLGRRSTTVRHPASSRRLGGRRQRTPNGVICQQLNQPGTETCNGLDDDCNGMVDDGTNLCPTATSATRVRA